MSSLADYPELIGFFSYSREDDSHDSPGGLAALRFQINHELRGQLGRAAKTLRLWQDKEAIASSTLWESEIKTAVAQSAFFIPIVTPSLVASRDCRFELEAFLAREAQLGRDDLICPIRRREAQHDESEKGDQRYGDGYHRGDARRTERFGELKKALHRSSPPAHETLSCRTRQHLPSLWLAPG
jgi:hypothetical protein